MNLLITVVYFLYDKISLLLIKMNIVMHSFLHVNISFTGNHLGGSTLELARYNSSFVEEGLGGRYF